MNNCSLIGRFKEILKWVAKKSGKEFSVWKEFNSTKTCSNPKCDFIHEKSLDPKIRKWKCPSCNSTHLRDENAAKNGLYKLNLPSLGHQDLIDIRTRCAWKYFFLGIVKIPGKEIVA